MFPTHKVSLFDMGEGTVEDFERRFDALVAAEYSVILFEDPRFTDAFVAMLSRVRALQPATFHAIVTLNGAPWSDYSDLPWLALAGGRIDEEGYVNGFISGILSESGRVGLIHNGGHWWWNRAFHAGFNVGLRAACAHCVVDIEVVGSAQTINASGRLWDRDADVVAAQGAEEGYLFAKHAIAHGNTSLIFFQGAVRTVFTPDELTHMPYATYVNTFATIFQLMVPVSVGEPFVGGTVLLNMANGAIVAEGCPQSQALAPCPSAGVPQLKQDAIARMVQGVVSRQVPLGVSLDEDAFLSRFTHPDMVAYSVQSLSDVFGDRATWRNAVPLWLGDYKIFPLSPPFDTMYSYLYASHSLTKSSVQRDFTTNVGNSTVSYTLFDRYGFAAASFRDFSVLYGGSRADGRQDQLSAEVVLVQFACNVQPETCNTDPTARLLGVHPRGGHYKPCVARITPDTLFVHGGIDTRGTATGEAWLFNVTSGTWKAATSSPVARYAHVCTDYQPNATTRVGGAHKRQCVAVAGGKLQDGTPTAQALLYCLDDDTWRRTSGLAPTQLVDPCLVATDDRLVLFGGQLPTVSDTPVDNAPSPMWVLDPSRGTWVQLMFNVPNLPRGPMMCAGVHRNQGTPFQQSTPGVLPSDAVSEFHRVYVFPINAAGETSSDTMQLVALPRLACVGPGLTLDAFGCGCVGITVGAAGDGSIDAAVLPAILGVGIAVAMLGPAVAFIGMQRRRKRLLAEAKAEIVPKQSELSIATILVQPLSAAAGSGALNPAHFAHIAHTLNAVADSYRVYETQRFGDSFTYACDCSERLTQMVLRQFEIVHCDQAHLNHSLRAAIHFGSPEVSNRQGKTLYGGRVAHELCGMLRRCPEAKIVVSRRHAARVGGEAFSSCHMSDVVTLRHGFAAPVDVVVLRPDSSTAVRQRIVALRREKRSVEKLAAASPVPASDPVPVMDHAQSRPHPVLTKSGSFAGSTPRTHNVAPKRDEVPMELGALFLKELIRLLRTGPGSRPAELNELMALLFRRLDLPNRTFQAGTRAGPQGSARRGRDDARVAAAVCTAIVREVDAPLQHLIGLRKTDASNPFRRSSVAPNSGDFSNEALEME